jgi:cell wall assembly regulator SMI1
MTDLTSVIGALRQAVQDFDREGVRLGDAGSEGAVRWLSQKLGFSLPTTYLRLLAAHDGAVLADPVYFGLLDSVKTLLLYRRQWADPPRFWPLSGDGCGNYYCLDVTRSDGADAPVLFFETIESSDEPTAQVAPSIYTFVLDQIAAQRSRLAI